MSFIQNCYVSVYFCNSSLHICMLDENAAHLIVLFLVHPFFILF